MSPSCRSRARTGEVRRGQHPEPPRAAVATRFSLRRRGSRHDDDSPHRARGERGRGRTGHAAADRVQGRGDGSFSAVTEAPRARSSVRSFSEWRLTRRRRLGNGHRPELDAALEAGLRNCRRYTQAAPWVTRRCSMRWCPLSPRSRCCGPGASPWPMRSARRRLRRKGRCRGDEGHDNAPLPVAGATSATGRSVTRTRAPPPSRSFSKDSTKVSSASERGTDHAGH